MRDMYKWYFDFSNSELDDAWNSGILTVDTNVLLDLYRYNLNTRNELLSCIENFKGEKWLCHQASSEFIKNRKKVIISADKNFSTANSIVTSIANSVKESINTLRGIKLIPDSLPNDMQTKIESYVKDALKSIEDSQKAYPDFLKEDIVLNKIADIFAKSIGSPLKNMDDILDKAKTRFENKIPPGYKDQDKDGDNIYGDFFLWQQIIDYAKSKKKTVILVTSERKEDWWEKHDGKTVGPRIELLKEAFEHSGQRVLIYQTDIFLKYANERVGQVLAPEIVEEIKNIDSYRGRSEESLFDENLVQFLSQEQIYCDKAKNTGKIFLKLHRDAYRFTGSGHFTPRLCKVPSLSIKLFSSPPDIPEYYLNFGTGTIHDFNIHLKSTEYGIKLPAGDYGFEYEATCTDLEETNDIGVITPE